VCVPDTIETYYDLVDQRLPAARREPRCLARTAHPDRRRNHQGAQRTPAFRSSRRRDRADLLRDHPAQGDEGFGEGNFRALFESIELDQIRRGVLKPEGAKEAS